VKALLACIGSRGDVQPLLALAIELTSLGHDAALCVAPNFRDWVESCGISCLPIGPDLRKLTGGSAPTLAPAPAAKPSPEQLRQLAIQSVQSQVPVLMQAARGCDLIVAAGALQIGTRSVAEALDVPYVFVAYCPAVLPSSDHPPPKMGFHHPQGLPAAANASLWAAEEASWNDRFRTVLNEERAKLRLPAIDSVRRHVFTDRPWLAADALLGPAAPGAGTGIGTGMEVVQTGAWFLDDQRPLPPEVEEFLAAGEPPVYLGFGSMRAAEDTGRVLIEAVRGLGLRSIIAQGWANLRPADTGSDCLSVGEVAHEALFPRVAAIVHHGGAGTTAAAARAGKPQVLVPHLYDQYYWAQRVGRLGIGVAGPTREALGAAALSSALRECLRPAVQARALRFAARVETRGARNSARLLAESGSGGAQAQSPE